jgi:hypothetical protein
MQTRQRGISIMGLIAGLFILVILALFGMKLIPSFMEYRTARNAIEAISREKQGASVADIRKAFEARATIDDISSVKPQDLEITKAGQRSRHFLRLPQGSPAVRRRRRVHRLRGELEAVSGALCPGPRNSRSGSDTVSPTSASWTRRSPAAAARSTSSGLNSSATACSAA